MTNATPSSDMSSRKSRGDDESDGVAEQVESGGDQEADHRQSPSNFAFIAVNSSSESRPPFAPCPL